MQFRHIILPSIVGAVILTSCGPTLEEGNDARIRVTPAHQITFSRITVGDTHSLPFVVTSVGRDNLNVRKIEWTGSSSVQLSATGNEFPRVLANQGSMPISVNYTPTEAAPSPNGIIKIYSNDPETPVYELEVIAQQLSPLIHVVPSSEEKLIFGQTDVGSILSKDVVITNVGDLPLELQSISLNASDSFSYTLQNADKLPVNLAANASEQLTVRVAFQPNAIGKQEGTLVLVSNDPTHPTYELPIIANSDTPCLQITPSLLEFSPPLGVGSSQTKSVSLTSCSDVPLRISDVIKQSGSDVFTHELTGANTELSNGENATLNVTFSPINEVIVQAEYVIMNNDPLQANAILKVMGSASSNQCPNAVVQGRLSSSSTWSKTLDLAPLDTVILDGSQSSDKESMELKYYWSIGKAPKDSTSAIAEDGDKASFFLDLAGSYELCLSVEDSDGMMSCNTDCVPITATPRETIHIQLVWHTPEDSAIGDDDGTDLDLHFLTLPDGKWADTGTPELNNGTDVYFSNQTPIWVVPNQGNEEPSLDIDDKDGEGPENINLDKPTPCHWYAIGVHYFDDNAFRASYATVRAYIEGKMLFEKANISLKQKGVFKLVAWMFWNGEKATFYESDLAYDRDEDWRFKTPIVPDDVIAKARESSPKCF